MIRSLVNQVLGGGRRRTAAPGQGTAHRGTTGGTSSDAAIGRGVRGLLSRLTRR